MAIVFESFQSFGQGHPAIEPPPFSRMPHPVDVKAVGTHSVEAREWRVEFLPAIVFHSRPVTLHEAISSSHPDTADIDWVIPMGWFDFRQKTRLQNVLDISIARRDNPLLLHIIWPRRPGLGKPPFLGSHSAHILDLRPSRWGDRYHYLVSLRTLTMILEGRAGQG